MHTVRRAIEVLFVLTLAALLAGGMVFVAGQAIALVAGEGKWLTLLNDTIKAPCASRPPSAPWPGSCSATSAARTRNSRRKRRHDESRKGTLPVLRGSAGA